MFTCVGVLLVFVPCLIRVLLVLVLLVGATRLFRKVFQIAETFTTAKFSNLLTYTSNLAFRFVYIV